MRQINIISSLVILAVSIVSLAWVIPNFIPNRHDPGDLPPNMMPIVSMATFALTGLILGISALRKDKESFDTPESDESTETLVFEKKETANLMVWLGVSLIYWLLLKFTGFEIASGIAIAAGMLYGGLRNIWIISGAAILFPVLITRLFWSILNISLP